MTLLGRTCSMGILLPTATKNAEWHPLLMDLYIGINTNGAIDYNPNKPFADVMRTWRLQEEYCFEIEDGTVLETMPTLDENGWPTTDFAAIIFHGRPSPNNGTL